MTTEEFKANVDQVFTFANSEKQAETTDLLTKLTDAFNELSTQYEQANIDLKKVKNDNETLRDVNAKLFLRVGNPVSDNKPEIKTPDDFPDMPFDALFNEKGELI